MVRLLLPAPILVLGWLLPLNPQDERDLEVALLELRSEGHARVQAVFLPYFDVADGALAVEITVVTRQTAEARSRGEPGETATCRFTSNSVDLGSVGNMVAERCVSGLNLDRMVGVTANVRENGTDFALNCRRETGQSRSQGLGTAGAAMRGAADRGAGFAEALMEGLRAGQRTVEQERVVKAEMEAAWRQLEQDMAASVGAEDARVYFCWFAR